MTRTATATAPRRITDVSMVPGVPIVHTEFTLRSRRRHRPPLLFSLQMLGWAPRSDSTLRHMQRLLIAFNLAGSLIAGFRHEPMWFIVSAAAFLLYVIVEDRALRRRISSRAWPSEGFARFNFNTNLYFSLRHMLLGTLLFAVSGSAGSLLGS